MKTLKRFAAALLAMMMVLTLIACEKKDDSPYAPYDIPWEKDAIAEAVEAKEMHYYFMSSEGYNVESDEGYKWGDSCLIIFPNGQTMLIDSGVSNFAPLLMRSLERLGIEKLDYAVMSHPHSDHASGFVASTGVLYNMEVGQLYYGGTFTSSWSNPNMVIEACEANNVPCDILEKGTVMNFGDVTMEVLWPLPEAVGQTFNKTPDVNNNSLVLRFDYGEHSSLFTGDLYMKGELAIIDEHAEKLDVDLLKVPHHGNQTSSSDAFVNAVSPDLAVATGYDALLSQVYRRYANHGTILSDELDGYIHAWSGADGALEHETAHERTNTYYDQFDKKS